MWVLNPCAPTYLKSCYIRVEREKQRNFNLMTKSRRWRSFSPLIFSTLGEYGPIAQTVYKRLATLISCNFNKSYNSTINYIRCCLLFSLIHSVGLCLRGTRSSPPVSRWIDLVASYT